MNFKFTFILFLLFVSPLLLEGQSYSEKRTYQKSFQVTKEMTLEITNKYGAINLTNWNKDSVSIRAEIEAFASNQTRLGKMFEGININFSKSSYYIIAQTDFTQNLNMFFESFKGMTKKLIPYESRIQINYFINLPENINVKIDNKYGDVYMENNDADISISLSNGSFKANSLHNAQEIKLTFCDAKINKIATAKLDASFSEVVIGESKSLSINSISSRIDLKQTGKLHTESRRDKFFIGSIGSVDADSYFTDFKIEELKDEANMITKYGSIYVELIAKSMQLISINSGYSDINLSFDPALSYNLDVRHINAFLTTPEKNARIEKQAINEDKKEYLTSGTIGKNPGNIRVKIDASHGNIFIK